MIKGPNSPRPPSLIFSQHIVNATKTLSITKAFLLPSRTPGRHNRAQKLNFQLRHHSHVRYIVWQKSSTSRSAHLSQLHAGCYYFWFFQFFAVAANLQNHHTHTHTNTSTSTTNRSSRKKRHQGNNTRLYPHMTISSPHLRVRTCGAK